MLNTPLNPFAKIAVAVNNIKAITSAVGGINSKITDPTQTVAKANNGFSLIREVPKAIASDTSLSHQRRDIPHHLRSTLPKDVYPTEVLDHIEIMGSYNNSRTYLKERMDHLNQ